MPLGRVHQEVHGLVGAEEALGPLHLLPELLELRGAIGGINLEPAGVDGGQELKAKPGLGGLGEEEGDVDDAVERLIQDGFLAEERVSVGDQLTFSSGVVRDVLYAGVSRRKRRLLHRKYAEYLEKINAGQLEKVCPQLLHHYSNADVPAKAVEYGLRLGNKSLEAFGAEDAIRSAKMVFISEYSVSVPMSMWCHTSSSHLLPRR